MKIGDFDKLHVLVELAKADNGRFRVADLITALQTPRRARRAIFVARKLGGQIEANRSIGGGHAVASYMLLNIAKMEEAIRLIEAAKNDKLATSEAKRAKKAKKEEAKTEEAE